MEHYESGESLTCPSCGHEADSSYFEAEYSHGSTAFTCPKCEHEFMDEDYFE